MNMNIMACGMYSGDRNRDGGLGNIKLCGLDLFSSGWVGMMCCTELGKLIELVRNCRVVF
jgi:hypothetical protein